MNTNVVVHSTGAILRERRLNLGISQNTVAAIAGVSNATVSVIERGCGGVIVARMKITKALDDCETIIARHGIIEHGYVLIAAVNKLRKPRSRTRSTSAAPTASTQAVSAV